MFLSTHSCSWWRQISAMTSCPRDRWCPSCCIPHKHTLQVKVREAVRGVEVVYNIRNRCLSDRIPDAMSRPNIFLFKITTTSFLKIQKKYCWSDEYRSPCLLDSSNQWYEAAKPSLAQRSNGLLSLADGSVETLHSCAELVEQEYVASQHRCHILT